MKLLWCHSHLVWLVFEGSIPTCTCFHSENFFVTLYLGLSLTLVGFVPVVLQYSLTVYEIFIAAMLTCVSVPNDISCHKG